MSPEKKKKSHVYPKIVQMKMSSRPAHSSADEKKTKSEYEGTITNYKKNKNKLYREQNYIELVLS